jgi:hypothetical protein
MITISVGLVKTDGGYVQNFRGGAIGNVLASFMHFFELIS